MIQSKQILGGEDMTDWSVLSEGQTVRLFRKGQMIYLQGTYPQYFYYLVSGTVRSYLSTAGGEERVLTVHHAGDLMGEASFFDECPRVTSAMALEDCRVVIIDRQRLGDIFSRHPELALPMLQYLARTVRLLSAHVDTASLPARCRVARYLLSLPRQRDGRVICTHESIGQAVGISRITVSRVLAHLVRSEMISTGYKSVRLISLSALEKLSEY